MPLPKIDHINFPVTLPSSKKKVRIRPYTVKEEKILLAAQASDDSDDSIEAVKQVVANCVLGDFDVDTAPIFDVEYLFIRLRMHSVNSIVELTYTDHEDLDDKGNGKQHEFSVDLDDVEVRFLPEHTNKIDFGNGVGAVMRYPSFSTMKDVREHLEATLNSPTKDVSIQALFLIYAQTIDLIYDDEKVYKAGLDFTQEEVIDFIDSLSSQSLFKMQEFFNTIPTVFYEIKYNNSKGEPKSIPLTGISDFFIL